ncbi:MAG: hypothetical protein LUE29_01515 [Lachnospiraceae bacterium]|nr:hypothetical protein [Lachnospiraceae bacterium]
MIRIGLCQCKLSFEQPEENLAMMERFLLYTQGSEEKNVSCGRVEDEQGASGFITQGCGEKMPSSKPDLLLFPELTLTGFTMKSREFALERDSEMIERVRKLAVRYETAIGFGCVIGEADSQSPEPDFESEESDARSRELDFGNGETDLQPAETDFTEVSTLEKAENESEKTDPLRKYPKNTYLIIDKDGRLIADYAKLHPFSYAGEDMHYSPGNSLSTFTLNGVRIGITVCYDLRFPEIYQAYADTCDVIIVAANWPAKRAEHWNALTKARAIETQCYIAAVNCVGDMDGQYYQGDSRVIGPDGESIPGRWFDIHSEKASPEGILFAEPDEERVRQVREAFPVRQDRRKEFYRDLLKE